MAQRLSDLSHNGAHRATGSAAIRSAAEHSYEVAVVGPILPDIYGAPLAQQRYAHVGLDADRAGHGR